MKYGVPTLCGEGSGSGVPRAVRGCGSVDEITARVVLESCEDFEGFDGCIRVMRRLRRIRGLRLRTLVMRNRCRRLGVRGCGFVRDSFQMRGCRRDLCLKVSHHLARWISTDGSAIITVLLKRGSGSPMRAECSSSMSCDQLGVKGRRAFSNPPGQPAQYLDRGLARYA